jgi:ATPase subunit of ABC transporter with duplicated ATPase domains
MACVRANCMPSFLHPGAHTHTRADVGLDGDIAEHNLIAGLSGGQKVKVVIAAAMWNNPHMLVLDEPTNYLDRDSLGGLAVAIRDWGGAVVMISHNAEFVGALCPEKWHVDAGRLGCTREGGGVIILCDGMASILTHARTQRTRTPLQAV